MARTYKKFQGNNILSELYNSAGKLGNSDSLTELRQEIAAALDISQVQLGRWLNNNGQPTLAQACHLAQLLGVSVDSLCRLAAE